MEQHTKIINAVAKQVLSPHGFFRKGSSRTWLQDNGYFLTAVEFQPSSCDRGTYLNVGMCFLWPMTAEPQDAYIAFNVGGRMRPPELPTQYISYMGNDALFTWQAEKFAKAALCRSQRYQRCCDLNFAHIWLEKEISYVGDAYHLAMLCFLRGDVEAGLRHMEVFLSPREWPLREWEEKTLAFCREEIIPRSRTPDSARQMVLDMIQTTRAAFLALPSFKGMNKEPYNG